MPSAAPVPPGPSVLALGSAAELLTRPGCPVCRYTSEASDRYLAWFALEAHADPVMITRMGASLGMCARHTRRLMSQPGAAARLTAVYRYQLQAAQKQLAGPGRQRLAACPACEHDEAAAGRALDTLLDGLSETGVWARYLELGGLCWPHARAAASVRGRRHALAWIVQAIITPTTDRGPSLGMLAGEPDHDTHERARLRSALPPEGRIPAGTCLACLAVGRAELVELTGLVRAAGTGSGRRPESVPRDAPRHGHTLCAGHLRDAALMTGGNGAALLGCQAECQAVGLARPVRPTVRQRANNRAGWLRGPRSPSIGDECPVCRAREQAARQELQRHRAVPPKPGGGHELCVRHVLALRTADPAARRLAADDAARRGDILIQELTEAFRKGTWAFRHESRGPEMTAWRRAAAFLNGGVFGGGPPG
jgi:hypothetical protein